MIVWHFGGLLIEIPSIHLRSKACLLFCLECRGAILDVQAVNTRLKVWKGFIKCEHIKLSNEDYYFIYLLFPPPRPNDGRSKADCVAQIFVVLSCFNEGLSFAAGYEQIKNHALSPSLSLLSACLPWLFSTLSYISSTQPANRAEKKKNITHCIMQYNRCLGLTRISYFLLRNWSPAEAGQSTYTITTNGWPCASQYISWSRGTC